MQGNGGYNGLRSWSKKQIGPFKEQIELRTIMSGPEEQQVISLRQDCRVNY